MPSEESSSFNKHEYEAHASFADTNWRTNSSSDSPNSARDPKSGVASSSSNSGQGDERYNSREPDDDSRQYSKDPGQDYPRRGQRYYRRDPRFDSGPDGSGSDYGAYSRRRSYSDQGNDYNRSPSAIDSSNYGAYGRRSPSLRDENDDYRREPRERRSFPGRYDADRPRYSSESNDYDRGYRSASYRSSSYRGGYAAEDRPREGRYSSDSRPSSSSQGSVSDNYRYSNRHDRPFNSRGYNAYQSYGEQTSSYRSPGRRDNRGSYRQDEGYNASFRYANSRGGDANRRLRSRRSGNYTHSDRRREPLSLAETLLLKYGKLARSSSLEEVVRPDLEACSERYRELTKLGTRELVQKARQREDAEHDLILQVLRDKIVQASIIYSEGTLELLPDGFGFLRKPSLDYVPSPDDVYVSPNQIRRFDLRSGVTVCGQIRPSKAMEKNFALLRVVSINGHDPSKVGELPKFLDLVVGRPTEQLCLAPEKQSKKLDEATVALRTIDKSAPIGFGQRVLVVAPSAPEKHPLLYQLVNATLANYPEAHVVLLLLANDPAQAREAFSDSRCEIVSAGSETEAPWKLQLANLAFEKAKRQVEFGKDVVVFCDSLTTLSQAWKEEAEASVESGRSSVNPQLIQQPKALLGLARKIDCGGSLTVVAFTLAEDGVVPEEYEGIVDTTIFLKDGSCSIDADKSFSKGSFVLSTPSDPSSQK